jgi:rhodanese-related sulfurtransferase
MARISVAELHALLQQGQRPLIIAVRASASQHAGRIPGAIILGLDLSQSAVVLPAGEEIIVYCACPNDASAARVARQLMRLGYVRVRPVQGGSDAWRDAGYLFESGAVTAGAGAS